MIYGFLRDERCDTILQLRDICGIIEKYIQNGYGQISKIPIICELINPENQQMSRSILLEIKYAIPSDWTLGQFRRFMDKKVYFGYLIINGRHPPNDTKMSELYDNYKDKDGFLYIKLWRAFVS